MCTGVNRESEELSGWKERGCEAAGVGGVVPLSLGVCGALEWEVRYWVGCSAPAPIL